MAQLMFPNIAGTAMQGFQQGRGMAANKLLGLAMSSQDPTQQAQLYGQAAQINPGAVLDVQNAQARNAYEQSLVQVAQQKAQQAQQGAQLQKIGAAARYMAGALQTQDPNKIEGAYQAVRPYLAELGQAQGKTPPAQWDPSMTSAIYHVIAQTASAFPADKPDTFAQGSMLYDGAPTSFDPRTGQYRDAAGNVITASQGQGQNGTGMGAAPAGALAGLPAETQAYVPKVETALNGAQAFDQTGQPTPQLLDAVMHVESNGNPNAVSPAGAQGAYQFMPATAASVGVADPFDPTQARQGAAKYLAQLYQQFGGDTQKAIAAYNAGPGRVANAAPSAPAPSGWTPKTAAAKAAATAGAIPSGFQWNADHTKLEPMPGGPEDPMSNPFDLTPDAVSNAAWNMIFDGKMPNLGRSKEALHVRATIMNRVADIAKQAGVSSADLATQAGRTKALQASLQNLQKQSDVMEKSENTFLNNANVLLDLSDKVSRSGVPAFNKFLLHVKTDYSADPDAAAFLTARNLVAQEYAKIASSATGAAGSSDTSQNHALELINTAQTPAQLRTVIATLEKDINGQKQSTEQQLLNISARMQQFGASNQYPGHAFEAGAQQPANGPIAVNPQTGERVQLVNGQWVKL